MTTMTETHGFQAEVKQLLHLMVHSLYSNREIFLRELISNASDAADKLRFEAVSDPGLMAGDTELAVRIEVDEAARSLRIIDNGIGMSREEVIRNLGTIARSGTAEFLGQLTGDQRQDAHLIGQFGVGFYSSFIVADRVEVHTRRAGEPDGAGVRWSSDGQGEFQVDDEPRDSRGTTVTLHLREDAAEFADAWRLRALVRKYSDHIAFPVKMVRSVPPAADEDEAGGETAGQAPDWETVNEARALWTRPRTEIKDEEYVEFYKHIAHDFQDPLTWSHNRVEGKREYTSLLYIPAHAPFDLYNRESPRGLKLYVQRVFIMDEAEQFLPLYLRFVRGVVDSNDLSLNVSRELLQKDAHVEAIRTALTKRVLGMLEKLAKDEPEKYRDAWREFGRVLKEGPAEDSEHRERIAGLLRFHSTADSGEEPARSLADYLAARPEGQKKIYYLVADSLAAARTSPHLEVFRDKGIEVLLMGDPIDEWLVGNLREFDGVEFCDVRRGDLDLAGIGGGEADEAPDATAHADLLERLKGALADDVGDVRVSARLTDSPACLVLDQHDMSPQLRRLMEAAGQAVPDGKPILEVNPSHPLVERLAGEHEEQRFGDLAALLLGQAVLAEGEQLKAPGEFVQRLNRVLTSLGE